MRFSDLLWTIIGFVFTFQLGLAQNVSRADSILDASFEAHKFGRHDRALSIALQLNAETDSSTYPDLKARIHTYLGNYSYARSDYSNAIRYHHLARIYYASIENKPRKATSLNNLGTTFYRLGLYEIALRYHLMSLDIAELENNPKQLGMLYTNIGNDYEDMGNFEMALAYHQKALAIDSALHLPENISADLLNIGVILGHLGRYRAAMLYHQKSLALDDLLRDTLGMANCYHNLGFSHAKLNQTDSAFYYAQKGLKIMAKAPDNETLRLIHRLLAELFLAAGHLDSALFYQRLLEKTEETIDRHSQIEAAILLDRAYSELPFIGVSEGPSDTEDRLENMAFFFLLFLLFSAFLVLAVLLTKIFIKKRN